MSEVPLYTQGHPPRESTPASEFTDFRGNSLIRNSHPPGTTIGPYAYSYCRVLIFYCRVQTAGGAVSYEQGSHVTAGWST